MTSAAEPLLELGSLPLPRTLAETVRERIATLPDDAREALLATAMLSSPMPFDSGYPPIQIPFSDALNEFCWRACACPHFGSRAPPVPMSLTERSERRRYTSQTQPLGVDYDTPS